jgi:DNA protecting protein DprA
VNRVYEASEEEYSLLPFVKPALISKLKNKSLSKAKEIIAYCENEGVGILTLDSPLYPKRLGRIQSAPIVLYYRGFLVDLDKEVCIAEVGTRNMTEYGYQMSYSMGYDLSRAGAVVVSGMAKGVDAMAHRGALDAGGYTVAVLGNGIERAYPSDHLGLMNEIIRHGAVITEFPPFTPPMGRNFPIRNRIISGLSLGTLVIEAPEKSGALITAETAAKQGREVFAIPGKLGEMSSTGTNALIVKGAKMVTSASDILLEYQPLYPSKINLGRISSVIAKNRELDMIQNVASNRPYTYVNKDEDANLRRAVERSERLMSGNDPKKEQSDVERPVKKFGIPIGSTEENESKTVNSAENNSAEVKNKLSDFVIPNDASELRRALLTQLLSGDMTSDELAVRSDFSISEVLVELTMLEIEGIVTALPGGIYKINS